MNIASIGFADQEYVAAGRLPDVPAVLEKEIEGVGRYTAGAICSMAYGVRTPIVSRIVQLAG